MASAAVIRHFILRLEIIDQLDSWPQKQIGRFVKGEKKKKKKKTPRTWGDLGIKIEANGGFNSKDLKGLNLNAQVVGGRLQKPRGLASAA